MKIGPLALCAVLSACSRGPRSGHPEPVVAVGTTVAKLGTLAETVTVYGEVSADASAQRALIAPVDAIVESIDAPIGSLVQSGAAVVHLHPSPQAELLLTQAEAQASQANEALARAKRLRDDGLVSDAEVEQANATAISANATVESLRSRDHVLRAPVECSVTQVDYSVGDFVSAGTTVAKLTADTDVRARFGIDPTLARQVRCGDEVSIAPTSGGSRFTSEIHSIDPVVDPATRLASVFAIVPAETEIAPGEPLEGEIVVSRDASAVLVPYVALLDDAGQAYVYRVVSGLARRTDVAVDGSDGQMARISRGIAVGDVVVTRGVAAVTDGVRVSADGSGELAREAAAQHSTPPGDPVK